MSGQEQHLENVLENILSGSLEKFSQLSSAGRSYFMQLAPLLLKGDSASIEALYAVDYERIPVDPKTFLTSTDYMGHFKCWPSWERHIVEACDPNSKTVELILTGAQGLGKTTTAMFVLAYKLYRLSCLRDPASFYGLARKSKITFGLYAVTMKQLEDTGFYTLRDMMLDQSPYFRDVFRRVPYGKEHITWEHGDKVIKVVVGSGSLHAIGLSLFAVAADELNYYDRGSRTAERARELVTEVSRRLESRFLGYGGEIPGVAVFISQTRTSRDFLENRARNMRNKKGVTVLRGPRWAFNPNGYDHPDGYHVGDPTFRVFVGDEVTDARVYDKVVTGSNNEVKVVPIDANADSPDESLMLNVPVVHYRAFDTDLMGSLRLIADVPSATFTPFFPRVRTLQDCFTEDIKSPMLSEVLRCYEKQKDFALKDAFNHELVTGIHMGKHAPIRHPESPRYIHLDLAQGSGPQADRAGIAMVHTSQHYLREHDGSSDVAKVGEAEMVKDIEVDFAVALEGGPFGEPLDFRKIRVFIEWLRRIGYHIRLISADQFQSFDMLQRLRELGFQTSQISVDRTSKPYKVIRTVMNEGRVVIPFPQTSTPLIKGSVEGALKGTKLFQEFKGLEYNVRTDKVDHKDRNPDGSKGSKDIADAVVGASFNCVMDVSTPGQAPTVQRPRAATKKRLGRYLTQVSKYL